jgi:hypothetical protein
VIRRRVLVVGLGLSIVVGLGCTLRSAASKWPLLAGRFRPRGHTSTLQHLNPVIVTALNGRVRADDVG